MEPTATSGLMATRECVEAADFEKVVHAYWPRIFRFVFASVRDEDAAENITQECFWRAHRAWSKFRGDSSVNTWLMRIAVNLIRDFARNRRLQFWRRAPALDAVEISDWVPDRGMSPEAHTLVREQVQAIWKATGALSPRQKTVFLLRFVDDMDLLEIAAATGMSEGAVKSHLFRAVHTVRDRLRKMQ